MRQRRTVQVCSVNPKPVFFQFVDSGVQVGNRQRVDVVNGACRGNGDCAVFAGTPSGARDHQIDIKLIGAPQYGSEIVWIRYRIKNENDSFFPFFNRFKKSGERREVFLSVFALVKQPFAVGNTGKTF